MNVNVLNFSEFTNLKLHLMHQLEGYFHKKLDHGRKLCLDEDLVLQDLADRLKSGYKNILVVHPPITSTEWYKHITNPSEYVRNKLQNPRRQRFIAPRTPTMHYHQNFSTTPYRTCTNKGISSAFHWERECCFNLNRVSPQDYVNNISSTQSPI